MNSSISHHTTRDGSSTLLSERYGAHYHSLNGAVTESMHVFIEAGLKAIGLKNINLLEVGFGTGLNAALSAQLANEQSIILNYQSIELFPLCEKEYGMLNYNSILEGKTASLWEGICKSPWNKPVSISEFFSIEKIQADFTSWSPTSQYHVVYFDAFAPNDQPEMWDRAQFQKVYNSMLEGGVLVTYCVKGLVKQALREVGFDIERLQGPPGKKHMLRAWKRVK